MEIKKQEVIQKLEQYLIDLLDRKPIKNIREIYKCEEQKDGTIKEKLVQKIVDIKIITPNLNELAKFLAELKPREYTQQLEFEFEKLAEEKRRLNDTSKFDDDLKYIYGLFEVLQNTEHKDGKLNKLISEIKTAIKEKL